MDMYGHTATELFRIDDLLDFSNDDLFSSSAAAVDYSGHNPPPTDTSFSSNAASAVHRDCPYPVSSGDFTADDLYVPSDDVAELEWLSQFVDDSFTDFTNSEFAGAVNFRPDPSSHCRSRSKRTRAAAGTGAPWISHPTEKNLPATASGRFKSNGGRKKEGSPAPSGDRSPAERMMTSGPRRCSHCSSEKTPQWRTGPMGPKTLCNACGVRYKSGRLVPEYRPAASPTFVLTQHSNSHRKVLELRRQKEILRLEQQQQVEQLYQHHHQRPHHRHHHDFEVC